jgi:Tfp pilus assembly protein PilP
MRTRQSRRKLLAGAFLLAPFLLSSERAGDVRAQEVQGEDAYRYDPAGKRDPFFSPLFRTVEKAAEPEETRTPLQRVDLGQLRLVGVILDTAEPKGLIEDNAGLAYIVTRGTLIGSKGGFIKTIEPRRIVVEEYETDFYGKRQAQERELQLVVADAGAETEASQPK